MSAVRPPARPARVAGAVLLTAACALFGVALLGVAMPGRPAAAASVAVRLDGLPSRMTAGGPAASLRVTLSNPRPKTITNVRLVYTIRLNDLSADQVQLIKFLGTVTVSGGDGEVHAVDTVRLFLGRATARYTLQFLTGAPSGRATVTVEAFLLDDDERLGSARRTTTVQSTQATASPTQSVEPTPSIPLGPADARPGTESPAAVRTPSLGAAADDGEATLWPLYLLGFTLVIGGGVAAFLMLRRPNALDGGVKHGEPGSAPSTASLTAPTAVFQVIRPAEYETAYHPPSAYPQSSYPQSSVYSRPSYDEPSHPGADAVLLPPQDPWPQDSLLHEPGPHDPSPRDSWPHEARRLGGPPGI